MVTGPDSAPVPRVELCVIASGSRGNCSVLTVAHEGERRAYLIDAGLSPRRTDRLLHGLGLSLDEIDSILFTHLDRDHCHAGWIRTKRWSGTLRMHRRHLGRARRSGLLYRTTRPFDDDAFDLDPVVRVRSTLQAHDNLGVATFRLDVAGGASLGFVTDAGSADDSLKRLLADVDVLAIESNYCPELQMASPRPWFLKNRIMGGAGHLSNDEASKLIDVIQPREHVVLLHLSQDCNDADLVSALHAGADYACTISEQYRPTRWIRISPAFTRPPGPVVVRPRAEQLLLFEEDRGVPA